MRLSLTHEHKFQPAPYESAGVSGTIELDSEKDGIDPADLESYANEVLENALKPFLVLLDQSSQTAEDKTHLHAWNDAAGITEEEEV
jgi:hypothetical protein